MIFIGRQDVCLEPRGVHALNFIAFLPCGSSLDSATISLLLLQSLPLMKALLPQTPQCNQGSKRSKHSCCSAVAVSRELPLKIGGLEIGVFEHGATRASALSPVAGEHLIAGVSRMLKDMFCISHPIDVGGQHGASIRNIG